MVEHGEEHDGEKSVGKDHPDTLRALGNLAVLLNDKGDFAEAESLCQRALQAQKCVLGPDHRDTLTSLNNMARMLERLSQCSACWQRQRWGRLRLKARTNAMMWSARWLP